MTIEEFVKKMSPWAAQAEQETGVSRELILAQWGLETGWGSSQAFNQGFNLAGIKVTKNWSGDKVGSYRAYSNLEESVKDYVRVMGLDYYTQVRTASNPYSQASALDDSPWAEDPDYGVKLRTLIPKVSTILTRSPVDKDEIPYFKGLTESITPKVDIPAKIEEGVEKVKDVLDPEKLLHPIFKFILYLVVGLVGIYGLSLVMDLKVKEVINPVK